MRVRHNRLAVFLPELNDGGAERITLNLIEGMLERGIAVDLVLAKAVGPFMNQIPEGTNIVNLDVPRVFSSILPLKRYLQTAQIDGLLAVMVHSNVVALIARRLAGVDTRIVAAQHNTFSQSNLSEPWPVRPILPHLVRFTFPWADQVVTVSQGMNDDLIDYFNFPEQLSKVIYNPVITPDIETKSVEPLDHPWFQPGEPPVILGIGRLSRAKNFEMLINAFAKIHDQVDAKLLILGEGDKRPELENQIKKLGLSDKISLPGFVDNPYPFIKKADVFALTSIYEGLPTVLIEAVYLGTKIVSTDCPSGPKEILSSVPNTFLTPMHDVDAFAEKLKVALSVDKGEVLREYWQPYALDHVVDQYVTTLVGEEL